MGSPYQYVFRRREVKYLLTPEQLDAVRAEMAPHMRPDEHGLSTLCNVYFDTPDHLLIRRSLEHPLYKEKLRVRSYGVASPDGPAFVEIKKKYRRTVYKRRVATTERQAMACLTGGEEALVPGQIAREVGFCLERYRPLVPSVHLSYEREAFFGRDDREFRITFDDVILWRDHDLSLTAGVYGEPLLPEGRVLMEVKAGGAYPMWASAMLSEHGIFPARFSKYGLAYQRMEARRRGAGAGGTTVAAGRCA